MAEHTLKTCPKCGQAKPLTLEHWYPDARYKAVFRSPCRDCHQAYRAATKERKARVDRAWYDRNRDRKLTYMQRYQAARRDELRAYLRTYYRANRECLREAGREYYQQNRDRMAEVNRRWAAQNREAVRAIQHNFRARRDSIPGELTAEALIGKLELQGGRCYYCGGELAEWQVEHKIPKSLGGSNHPANVCIACPSCNAAKASRPFWEFLAESAPP